jgi:hypothetical protein
MNGHIRLVAGQDLPVNNLVAVRIFPYMQISRTMI